MTRVSEQSNALTLRHSMNKAKHKLEELQLKGASLKDINKPSDDPSGTVDILSYTSRKTDNTQFLKNSDFALMHLKFLEDSVEELTNVMVRAKEIAISQASDLYDTNIRGGVARELVELRNQALGLANRRFGNRYIFGGHSTLQKPFNREGHYQGDTGKITVEVAKDNFVPINFTGIEVFYSIDGTKDHKPNPLKPFRPPEIPETEKNPLNPEEKKSLEFKKDPQSGRFLASVDEKVKTETSDEIKNLVEDYAELKERDNIFGQLETLTAAMKTNDTDLIQNMLEKLDDSVDRLITLRTKIGAITNSVEKFRNNLESENLVIAEHKSKLGDADVTEVFMDLQKQQQILKTTYKSGQVLLNASLLDYLK